MKEIIAFCQCGFLAAYIVFNIIVAPKSFGAHQTYELINYQNFIPKIENAGINGDIKLDFPTIHVAKQYPELMHVNDIGPILQKVIDNNPVAKLVLPAGELKLASKIVITHGNIIIEGNNTTIRIKKSLSDITDNDEFALYSKTAISGAFIEFSGKLKSYNSTAVIKSIAKNDDHVVIEDVSDLEIGDLVQLKVNANQNFGKTLLTGYTPGEQTYKDAKHYYKKTFRIKNIDQNKIYFDSAIGHNIATVFRPIIEKVNFILKNSGIRNVDFIFDKEKIQPHLREIGYNALIFNNVYNVFAHNLSFVNADNAISLNEVHHCSVYNVDFYSTFEKKISGHHGIWLKNHTNNCNIASFNFQTMFYHDFSVEAFAHENLIENGKGLDMNFDHHRNIPFHNVYKDINVGEASRLWHSGGRHTRGPHSGIKTTFINLVHQCNETLTLPDWPSLIYISKCNAKAQNRTTYVEILKY